MTPEQENELLLSIAGGIDLPTALAALPDDRATRKPANIPAQIGGLAGAAIFLIYWYFLR